MTRYTATTQPTFNGLPIQTNEELGLACRDDILAAIHQQMSLALKDGRTMFTRFDLRLPTSRSNSPCNTAIQTFFNTFTTNLKRKGLRPRYLWVREQSREKHQHYHCIILTNATDSVDRINKDYTALLKIAEKIWSQVMGLDSNINNGLVDFCNRGRDGQYHDNGLILYQNDVNGPRFQGAYQWASYLAKTNTKVTGHGYKNWSSSAS